MCEHNDCQFRAGEFCYSPEICLREPAAGSGCYEQRLEKADKDINQLRAIYDEWRESKDEGLVTALFTRAVSAINAATSS